MINVVDHIPWARSIARSRASRLRWSDRAEAEGIALLALVEASRRPSPHVNFRAYAHCVIRGAIIDEHRRWNARWSGEPEDRADDSCGLEERAEAAKIAMLIVGALGRLSLELLARRLMLEETLADVGERTGVSKQTVLRREKRAIAGTRKLLALDAGEMRAA